MEYQLQFQCSKRWTNNNLNCIKTSNGLCTCKTVWFTEAKGSVLIASKPHLSTTSITSKSYRSFLKDDKLGGICITVQTSSRNIINLLFIDLISSLLNIQLTLEVIILHVIAFEPQHICSFNNINLTHWSSGTKCTIMIILLFICRFLHQY